jgi:hypothetical protein
VVGADASGAPPALLPDLVVHWTDAVFDRPVRVKDPALDAWPVVPARTGQHRAEGFCLARGLESAPGGSPAASQLHHVLVDACGSNGESFSAR